MITEKEIVSKYLGVTYKHKGTDLIGLDCWTLVVSIYRDAGIDISFMNPTYDEQCQWHEFDRFIESYHQHWEKVDKPKFMDVILLSGYRQHAGVWLSENRFIHAAKAGVIISRICPCQLGRQIQGFYRIK